MRLQANIFFLVLFIGISVSFSAFALKDSANLALDKLEMATNELEALEETKLEIQKEMESIKAGVMGPLNAVKGFGDAVKNLDIDRIKATVKEQVDLAKNAKNKEKLADKIEETMVPVYGKGHDSDVAYEQKRKRTELLQNHIADLYAHALVTRALIGKERDKEDSPITQENARELINANRALVTKINKRYNDILFMEAQLLEFETTNEMTTYQKKANDEETTEGENQ